MIRELMPSLEKLLTIPSKTFMIAGRKVMILWGPSIARLEVMFMMIAIDLLLKKIEQWISNIANKN